jgi:hypothetical protein
MFAGAQCGLMGVPPTQSVVNVIFKMGDKRFPMWVGGAHKTGETPADYLSAKQGLKPKGWMWITPGGYGIVFDEQAKTVKLKTPTPSSSEVLIDLTLKKVEVVSDAAGGQQYKLVLDETAQKASLETPTGQKIELDETAGTATLTGTQKAILTATFMEIGLNATQAAILGNAFASLWINHGHLFAWAGPSGTGTTSGPVTPALTPGTAALVPGTHLSPVTKLK